MRVVNEAYRTAGRTGTVTAPDPFWTFGPCVLLDGQTEAAAFLTDDLVALEADIPVRPAAPEAARDPLRGEPAAAPLEADPWVGWAEALDHVAARLDGGPARDLPPDLATVIESILARVAAAQAKARSLAARRAAPPEPAAPAPGAATLANLIRAVSEIVIEERARAASTWQARVATADAETARERTRRRAAEAELERLRGLVPDPPVAARPRLAAPEPDEAAQNRGTLVEVLTCAEEYISGASLNRALVLHALRDTLGNLKTVSALDALKSGERGR